MRAAERVLIDTNVLIYATLRDDPRSERSRAVLLSPMKGERYVSVQNLAELYPNLTGPKMEEPDSPAVAREKIRSIASLPDLQVLPLTADVQAIALELCKEHGITGQRYFDAQIVAVMKAYGITTLFTENAKDFACFDGIRVVDPFVASGP